MAKPATTPPVPPALADLPPIEPRTRGYAVLLGIITAAAAVVRGLLLDHPMRYDETFAYMFFASGGPSDWFNYLVPNNHVLHTVLVHFATELGDPPEAIRLPAYLAGVAMVPAGAMLAVELSGRRLAGLLAAMLIAGAGLLIEYSVNARGYGMLCLATLLLGWCTVRLCRDAARRRLWALWAVLAAAGAWTIPVMLYPVAIFAAVLALQCLAGPGRPRARRLALVHLAVALAASAALTSLAYLPVVAASSLEDLLANRFISPLPIGQVLSALPGLAGQTLADWTRDAPWALLAVIAVGLAAAALRGLRRRQWLPATPLLAAVVLPAAAIAQRVTPFPRVWLFLLPVALTWSAVGLAELAAALTERTLGGTVGDAAKRARAARSASLALAALVAVGSGLWALRTMRHGAWLVSEDPRTLVDAAAIIADAGAEMSDGHTVMVSKAPSWASLLYYQRRSAPDGPPVQIPGVPAPGPDGPPVAVVAQPAAEPLTELLYADEQCRRVLIVVSGGQSLPEVIAANERLSDLFGPPRLWKSYPRATVYLATRRQP